MVRSIKIFMTSIAMDSHAIFTFYLKFMQYVARFETILYTRF